jgi:hypothetical protein
MSAGGYLCQPFFSRIDTHTRLTYVLLISYAHGFVYMSICLTACLYVSLVAAVAAACGRSGAVAGAACVRRAVVRGQYERPVPVRAELLGRLLPKTLAPAAHRSLGVRPNSTAGVPAGERLCCHAPVQHTAADYSYGLIRFL